MSEVKICIRFSDGLRARLKQVARDNRRSMHAEILDRLSRTYEVDLGEPIYSSKGRNADKTLVRLDHEMHWALKSSAIAAARSLNAEIVYRLSASFVTPGAIPITAPPMPGARPDDLVRIRRAVADLLLELDRLIERSAA